MAASPTPAAQQRLFHLAVSIDRELLQFQPGLADAVRDRLMAHIEPACSVEVTGGEFQGFTVEASSYEDEEGLGRNAGRRLAAGLRWVEDQATEILDRIFYPSSYNVIPTLRAHLSLVLAKTGRAALAVLLLLGAAAGSARAESAPTKFRSMFYGLPGQIPEVQDGHPSAVQGVIVLDVRELCRPSLLQGALMYLPGGLADELTTEYFLALGGHEINRVMRSRWVRLPFKALIEPMGGAFFERKLAERWGTWAGRGFRYAMWVTRAVLMASNIRYGNSLRGPVRSIFERSGQ